MKRDLMFGRSFVGLVAPILLSVLVYKFVKNNKKSAPRKANDISASSSSAASTGSNDYDVFLSFRGKDTRKGFADHLYNSLVNAGISVFRDEEELHVGENIGHNILQALKNSKISIVILSRNYASSRWCLQELAQMLECGQSLQHTVLPIFYQVEPAEVRHQRGSFGEIFSHLSRKHCEEDVARWRRALQQVASMRGWIADGYEGELVKMVTTKVWAELKRAFRLVVTEQLVGIEKAVEDVLRLMDHNSSATQVVGIYGMGGIGKTTLAKVLYNNLSDRFGSHSFIADIRESSQRRGIPDLQKQLLSDILKIKDPVSTVDEGLNTMESRFRFKKVLILLDDVDDEVQLKNLLGKLHWFGMGSVIIITTRVRSVLENVGVTCRYELPEITMDQSLFLFSRHAFEKDCPPQEFLSLAQSIVSTTGCLPLALEVIGSYLHGKPRELWRVALKKLKKIPHEDVQAKLRISYDTLNDEDQRIFLDIACFFIGTDVRIAIYMWNAFNFFPEMGIETLSFSSLIKIGDNHELKMHDQLRDLGRNIARHREERRLWDYEEASAVLERNKEENKNIEALRLDIDGSAKFIMQRCFKSLPNLKFLHVRDVGFAGDFKESFSELIWLKWQRCPDSFNATHVQLEKLLILDLSGGKIRENWRGWVSIKMVSLKVLNLSRCSDLKSTPSLSAFKNLEMLILESCETLLEIHPSIGDAKRLISLNLRKCESLKKLPEELGKLKELEELLVDETHIQEIPQCIESLQKLKRLSAIGCGSLSQIPPGIDRLVNLW